MLRKFLLGSVSSVLLSTLAVQAHAALTDDLSGLVTQLTPISTQLSQTSVTNANTCSSLGSLNTSIETYIAQLNTIYAKLAGPYTMTTTDYNSLDQLSNLSKDMAAQVLRIALEMHALQTTVDIVDYRDGLTAMLRLSDDIGKMADRILQMADRILTMANNIGKMADRILYTQQLQNANVKLTQASMLQTQQNMIAMSSSLSTIGSNLTLGLILTDTQNLSTQMAAVKLTNTNAASELARINNLTAVLLDETMASYTWLMVNSKQSSRYINGDNLTILIDISSAHAALGRSLEAYATAINQIGPLTSTPILSDATKSMLALTADIGEMSGRIMEMVDKIVVMADNIGVMAGRITETQNLQQTNIEMTQSSIVTSQNMTINAIKTYLP